MYYIVYRRCAMHIWLVEVNLGNKWEATEGAYLNRAAAREGKRAWAGQNPKAAFRVRKYLQA